MLAFVPVLFGLSLGLVFSRGLLLLPVLPLTAALLFMVTALTYQYQGWLASLMGNPRRRRTMAVATGVVRLAGVVVPQAWATKPFKDQGGLTRHLTRKHPDHASA